MVEVKLRKRLNKFGKNTYYTYIVTLPKAIIESDPHISKSTKLKVMLEKGKIVLSPL